MPLYKEKLERFTASTLTFPHASRVSTVRYMMLLGVAILITVLDRASKVTTVTGMGPLGVAILVAVFVFDV